MDAARVEPFFWQGKRVFLTGHTGFKGGWLALWLVSMGAKVTGFALTPNTNPSFYAVSSIENYLERSYIANITDPITLRQALLDAKPDIVIHMAAQSLVRYGYKHPVETYATNVMGTVNVLENIRRVDTVRAVVIVTTDKCYENKEWHWGYRETEPMGGHDPYSSSKGCAELVTNAYRTSFFSPLKYMDHGVGIATARAGNVIGGGDWAFDRLIPDALKAFQAQQVLKIRQPLAVRPWQHVLEPLSGYLVLAQALFVNGTQFGGAWNFGPRDEDARSVKEVINLVVNYWETTVRWEEICSEQPHEATLLKLDCSKARHHLKWFPRWTLEHSVKNIVQWHNEYARGSDMRDFSLRQIEEYQNFELNYLS